MAWTQLSPSGTLPGWHHEHTAIYDANNQRMLIFGGTNFRDYLNDAWHLDLKVLSWTQLFPGGTAPPGRTSHTAIYDSIQHRMIVFGGANGSIIFNDIWQLDLNTLRWTQLLTTGAVPNQRWDHSAIYDATNRRMIVFGGYNGFNLNDVWQLDLNTLKWTQLFPTGTRPLGRSGHTAIYDPFNERMIVFGGSTASYANDVWQLDLKALSWTQLFPGGTAPPVRSNHTAIYDPMQHRMIVLSGFNSNQSVNDVWQLDLPRFASVTLLSPKGGELWAGGIQQMIKYSVLNSDLAHHLTLSYSIDGGTSYSNLLADGVSPNSNT